jgi:hypothetical protein
VILQTYGKEIVALLVPLIAWSLNTFFKARAKLLISRAHGFTFLVPQPLVDQQGNQIRPNQTITTNSFVLSNAGRETATKIEIVFNWEPFCVNIWPARHYEKRTEPDNRFTITVDNLAPREDLTVEVFSINSDLPEVVVARCEQCVAQSIVMAPIPVMPAWKRRFGVFLMLAGISATVYVCINLIQFLVLKTPH